MKQVKVKLPNARAKEFATYLANNGIVTLLSWSETDGFFSNYVCAELAIKDENTASFQTSEWAKFVQQS